MKINSKKKKGKNAKDDKFDKIAASGTAALLPGGIPQEVLDMPVDPNEPTYCLCQQVSYGEMIGCDNNSNTNVIATNYSNSCKNK